VTSRDRLVRAQRALLLGALVRALLLAAAVFASTIALLLVADAGVGLSVEARARVRALPLLAGLATLLALAWRARRAGTRGDLEDVALWFERRLPSLEYALVTQLGLGSRASDALEARINAAPLEREVVQAWRRAAARPALLLALLAIAIAFVPRGALGRVMAPAAGDLLDRPGTSARAALDPLATIVVRVTPPAYAAAADASHDNPATVSALVGSSVLIEGLGADVRAVSPTDTLRSTPRTNGAGGWSIATTMGRAATALRLRSPRGERVLLLDPVTDSAPTVRLELPLRDTVLRVAAGGVRLAADLSDDLGLASAQFELIVSAGAGETFTFRTGAIAARRFDGTVRSARLEGDLALDTLQLGPGDLVHLRAIATDRNDVTGPGRGVSETRSIRIARADEYDSVAVEPAPPPALDTAALSQRMLLILTEELHAREPRLARADVVSESRRIARDQTRLRKRVGEVVFQRLGEDNAGEHSHFAGDGHAHGEEGPLDPDQILAAAERAANVDATRLLDSEGDETPVVAINRPLLEAYNHMWRASTELETANPAGAIPWMRRAIEALQRARAAERIYLRGRPPRVVIDLARVRGTGKDESAPNVRTARPPLDPDRAARLARFDAALQLVADQPAAAADSILLLRITVPADERAAAMALDAAATALRRGGDVTAPLASARRALAGEPPRRAPLSAWGH
jgi:hypothetical protein